MWLMSLISTWAMWTSAVIQEQPLSGARLKDIANLILKNYSLYTQIKSVTGVPEYVTGCFDYRESSFDHSAYLANGDPLFNSDGEPIQTSHVPVGLGPIDTSMSDPWVQGAILSLKHEGFDKLKSWDLLSAITAIEAWNGFGYERYRVNSPYLWSKTQYYSRGLFVRDGEFNKDAIDEQMGCVPILLTLKAMGVDLNERAPTD